MIVPRRVELARVEYCSAAAREVLLRVEVDMERERRFNANVRAFVAAQRVERERGRRAA